MFIKKLLKLFRDWVYYNNMDDEVIFSKQTQNNLFSIMLARHYDRGFSIGGLPIWVHSHYGTKWHYHLLLDIGFWFIEIQIGKDGPEENEETPWLY